MRRMWARPRPGGPISRRARSARFLTASPWRRRMSRGRRAIPRRERQPTRLTGGMTDTPYTRRTSMEIPRTMKATVLVAPHRFELLERPVPVPGDEDVLVRVRACGVCGTDLKIIHDGMPDMPPYGEFIFGHEYAGDIVAVGRTVDEFQVGDRVVVEAHMGCRRCENCIRGLYTACLNYGNRKRGHRANGMTTNGGLAEYAVNHVNTLYRIPDNVSYEEAVVVMTSGSPLFGIENAG